MSEMEQLMALTAILGQGGSTDIVDPYGLRPQGYDVADPYGVYADPTTFKAQSQYAVKPNIPNKAGPVRSARNNIGTLAGAVEAATGLGETAKVRSGAIGKGVRSASKMLGASASQAGHNGRIAMQALRTNPALAAGLKWAGPVGAALAAGDLILGDESLANKGMDVGFMAAGGALGSFVPVVGTAMGAAGGKAVSDGLQWLFGDKKTPDQRRMEEALTQLGGVI